MSLRLLACSLVLAFGAASLATGSGPAVADVVAEPSYATSPSNEWYATNGTVRAIVSTGSAVVIGGDFTTVRDRVTGQTVQRNRIAAFDAGTGALLPGFSQGANAAVWSLTSDGNTVWVGGDFTTIAGVNRNRIAALNASNGQPVPGFNASSPGRVFALANSAGTVYAGGAFGKMSGKATPKLAAVDGTTGAPRSGWSGSANANVRSVAVIPGTDALAVGGAFTSLSGQPRSFLGAVRLSDGAATSFAPSLVCDECWLLDVTASATTVYGAMAGPGGRAIAWDLATGARIWVQRADGDVQAVELVGDTLFVGGHFSPRFGSIDGEAQTRHMLAAVNASTGQLRPWAPTLSGGLGVWTLWGDADGLWVGGSFRQINGAPVARLGRFAALSAS